MHFNAGSYALFVVMIVVINIEKFVGNSRGLEHLYMWEMLTVFFMNLQVYICQNINVSAFSSRITY